MSFSGFFRAAVLAALAIGSLPSTSAHSWIEEYQVIGSNGSYIGDRGYSRGYVARTNVTGGYNGFSMDYLVPQVGVRINTSDSLCHPAQRTSNYSNPLYPKLKVAPGEYVAMKYLENGHVTLPWNQEGKPMAAGTVFVYGTTQPAEDEKMTDVLAWTSDGKGGNGKGWLMTAQNFDDGRCHQINCGNISTERQYMFPAHVAGQPTSSVEQWCETDLKIPSSQVVGSLTTYWVWQWPTAPNADCGAPEGKDEYYTTCADFDIISAGSGNGDTEVAAEADIHTIAQENPQSTAVSDFSSRTAYTTSPQVIMIEGTETVGQTITASAAFMSGCSAVAGQPTVTKVDVPASCDAISIFTGAAVSAAVASVAEYATTPQISGASPVATTSAAVSAAAAASAASALSTSTSAVVASVSQAPSAPQADTNAVSSTTVMATVTISSTTTTSTVVTSTSTVSSLTVETTYAAMSAVSSALLYSSSSAAVAADSSITIATISTVSAAAPVASTPTTLGTTTSASITPAVASAAASLDAVHSAATYQATATYQAPAGAAPTVVTNGMIEDVVVSDERNGQIGSERVAGHRRHARSFGRG